MSEIAQQIRIVHPVTGEPLAPEEYVDAIRQTERYLEEVMWNPTRAVRGRLRSLRETTKVTLPARRYQSDVQQKVARCPRCGGDIE